MLMPRRARTKMVRRSLVTARAGAVSGRPFAAGVSARARELRDGGGLRSFGRWPP